MQYGNGTTLLLAVLVISVIVPCSFRAPTQILDTDTPNYRYSYRTTEPRFARNCAAEAGTPCTTGGLIIVGHTH